VIVFGPLPLVVDGHVSPGGADTSLVSVYSTVLVIAWIIGALAGTRICVPGWVPLLALAGAALAVAAGFVLGYEDDTAGGGRGFQSGLTAGAVIIVVAAVATGAFMSGSRRAKLARGVGDEE
jgi:hypothetical protein